jgi:transcriptional regulator with XRE-family HTH domain
MTQSTSPIVAGWELALRLRERRDEMGVEVKTIVEVCRFSRNYWSAVENERRILSEENLIKVLELFECDEEEREELLALRAVAKERGWWNRYSAILDDNLQRLLGLEDGAHSIHGYESLLIPGLLQTPEYARALMTPDVNIRRVEVDQLVEVRMRRQQRLVGDNPIRLTELISEAALRQEVGGSGVLRRQLEHLAKLVQENPDSIDVRVIPFTAPSCGLFGAATVHMIGFANPRLRTVIWQETVTSWGIRDDRSRIRDIEGAYGDAMRRALNKKESLVLINQRIEELA